MGNYLRARGVSDEQRVGLCVDRGLDMVVAMLAILKAGATYLPIDPSYPPDRIRSMLDGSQSGLVVTQQRHREVFEPMREVICLDTERRQIGEQSSRRPECRAVGDSLAYVMYTSGTTGRPKGVMVSHRSVVRLVKNCDYAELSDEVIMLQMAPVTFDASTFEMWGVLLNGGRLIVMERQRPTLEEIGRKVKRHEVTTMWLTAGLFHLMVQEQMEEISGVRQMLAGGDVLMEREVERYLEESRGELINGYGPTENTTFTCCHRMRGAQEMGRSVPIGKAISNTRAYVLDERMKESGIGVVGRLYAGGDGLGRGYEGWADQTAEKFRPDPYSERGGERLYDTGDEVRQKGDGRIEFIGRRDGQVKVRGYRVEMGEVEVALRSHWGVEEAVVVLKGGEGGEKRLVGYVVMREEVSKEELSRHVSKKVPEYMRVREYVRIERVPLTENGKVDRVALMRMEERREDDEEEEREEEEEERGGIEEVVGGIFEQVLRVERVGRRESFFDAGGHSLLAMLVVIRIQEAFKIDLPLQIIFEKPTVAELAEAIDSRIKGDQGLEAPPILPASRSGELPLSFAQQQMWFLAQLMPENPAYNIYAAFDLKGVLDVTIVEQCLNEIIRRHEVLRTNFPIASGQPILCVYPTFSLDLYVEDISDVPESEQADEIVKLTIEEALIPFDLSRDILVRAKLIKKSEQDHTLLMILHHIVADAWTLEVFIREFASLYKAFLNGKPSPLKELPIQYADYAVWQREWLQGEVLEKNLEYWRKQLAGAPEVLALSTDRQRPPIQTFRGAHHFVEIPEDLAQRLPAELKAIARDNNATMFMTMLAAFNVLLMRYSGQVDIVVGTPIANRTRGEVEPLIGFFVNTLVIRTELSGEPTFKQLLGRVREACVGAYAHQDLPFERLVEELQPDRNLSRSPLFQVAFSLHSSSDSSLQLDALSLSQTRVENRHVEVRPLPCRQQHARRAEGLH